VDRGRCGRDSTARIIEVDNFNAQGELPQSLGQVMQRAKDIQYASKTRFKIERIQEIGQLRAAGRLVGRLPPELRSDPDAQNWLPPVTREKLPDHPPDQYAPLTVRPREGLRIFLRYYRGGLDSRS
jgi:hypothetical protein